MTSSIGGRGGISQIMTVDDRGGGGVSQIMTVDDRGEGGSQPNVMSFLDE